MRKSPENRPVVLCIGGHDPVGGAGIQADIETVAALGGHAATAITCLTVQDSRNVRHLQPVDAGLLHDQIEAALGDMAVAAIKIGLIGDAALVPVIGDLAARHPDIPLVLDPVLAAGGGSDLAGPALLQAISAHLLPRTTLLTPNLSEARRLSGKQKADDCAAALLATGCRAVLLTGTDEVEDEQQVINRLYRQDLGDEHWHWPRLPHSYHGSGCTLASACACELAYGNELHTAVSNAQRYTYESLQRGWRPGHGQYLPWRRT